MESTYLDQSLTMWPEMKTYRVPFSATLQSDPDTRVIGEWFTKASSPENAKTLADPLHEAFPYPFWEVYISPRSLVREED